jgi:hypothetical protein
MERSWPPTPVGRWVWRWTGRRRPMASGRPERPQPPLREAFSSAHVEVLEVWRAPYPAPPETLVGERSHLSPRPPGSPGTVSSARLRPAAPARASCSRVVWVWVGDGVLLAVDLVAVDPAAVGVGVLTSFETGEPALQPARARPRQVRMLAHVVPLAVPLRRIVRSVRWAVGDPKSVTAAAPPTSRSSRYAGSSILSCARPFLGKGH